jgi:hypothetical protein
VQTTPAGSNIMSARPLNSWARPRSISLVPKPLWLGARMGGPPASFQHILSRGLSDRPCRIYVIVTRPVSFDSAPYLTAFITSSSSAMAMAKAIRGGSLISTPRI